jgi:hypothetical protein
LGKRWKIYFLRKQKFEEEHLFLDAVELSLVVELSVLIGDQLEYRSCRQFFFFKNASAEEYFKERSLAVLNEGFKLEGFRYSDRLTVYSHVP